jgi:hypothetical protein
MFGEPVHVNVNMPEQNPSPPPDNLTELGARTLSGYQRKWGPADGAQKFNEAMNNGYIDRHKMVGRSKKA